jgi:hypothetical protein
MHGDAGRGHGRAQRQQLPPLSPLSPLSPFFVPFAPAVPFVPCILCLFTRCIRPRRAAHPGVGPGGREDQGMHGDAGSGHGRAQRQQLPPLPPLSPLSPFFGPLCPLRPLRPSYFCVFLPVASGPAGRLTPASAPVDARTKACTAMLAAAMVGHSASSCPLCPLRPLCPRIFVSLYPLHPAPRGGSPRRRPRWTRGQRHAR